MYAVYVNGQYFGGSDSNDPKTQLIDPNVKVEVNKAGTFQCTITPFHDFYNKLIKMKSFVNVYQNGDHIFSGRLLYTETDSYGQMNCYFEGDLSYFIDSVQEPGLYKETVRQRFERFLETHNSQVDPEKQFYFGTIELDEAEDLCEFKDNTYKDTKSMMDSLVDDYGGYLVVRHLGGFAYVDYLKEYDQYSSQKLRFRKNILDIQDYISGEDLFTVLLPLSTEPEEEEGASPTAKKVPEDSEEDPYEEKIMTIESVNNGSKFIEIEELVDIFGRIVKIQTFDNAQSPEDLFNMGKRYIEDMAPGLTKNVTVTALDESFVDSEKDPIRLGDFVEIFYEPLNLRRTMSCVSIDYDLSNPENTVYRFGTMKQDLSGKYSSTVSVFNDYSQNNNSVTQYHNKIINHIEQDLIVNARDIEINARNIEINANQIAINAMNIQVNADAIEVNAEDIAVNANRIALLAEEILLYAKKDYVDEINGRTVELEAYIKLLPGIIDMKASKTEVDALADKYRSAQLEIDGLNATIKLKAEAKDVTALAERVGSAEIAINGLEGSISLKASISEVKGLEQRVSTAEININALEGTISLKAERSTVTDLEKKLNTVEINLNSVESTISLHAKSINQIDDSVNQAWIQINGMNASITLKADSSVVDDLGKRMNSAEITISGLDSSIKLKADSSTVTAFGTRLTSAEATIDGLNSSIKLKADSKTVTALSDRVSSAEVTIDGLNSSIKLKADSTTVTALSTRMGNAEISINGLESSISLKASTTTVNTLTNRVSVTESKIEMMDSSITLSVGRIDNLYESNSALWTATNAIPEYYTQKGEIISVINMTPESITIQAKRVNLVGYVTAQQLDAETARVDNFFNGYSMISTAYVNYINCQGSMSFKGTFLAWKEISIPTSVSGPTFNYVTLKYKDHDGNNKTQVVYTSVNTAASLSKTTYTLLGSQ